MTEEEPSQDGMVALVRKLREAGLTVTEPNQTQNINCNNQRQQETHSTGVTRASEPVYFGQSSPTHFGENSQANSTPFGQTSPTHFGQNSQPNSTPFGQTSPTHFGQNSQLNSTPFGQTSPTHFGQNISTPFGQTSPMCFGQPNTTHFGEQCKTNPVGWSTDLQTTDSNSPYISTYQSEFRWRGFSPESRVPSVMSHLDSAPQRYRTKTQCSSRALSPSVPVRDTDRSGLRSPCKENMAFQDSLRSYPNPALTTTSNEIIQRLISSTQAKNSPGVQRRLRGRSFSRFANSRGLTAKVSQKKSSKNIQTYTRLNMKSPVRMKSLSDRKNLTASPANSENIQEHGSTSNGIEMKGYDFMKEGCSRFRPLETDVRYLSDVTKFVQDAINSLRTEPQVCPRIAHRYSAHVRQHHRAEASTEVSLSTTDQRCYTESARSSKTYNTRISRSILKRHHSVSLQATAMTCNICNKRLPCVCEKILVGRDDKTHSPFTGDPNHVSLSSEITINSIVDEWLQQLPVRANYTTEQKTYAEVKLKNDLKKNFKDKSKWKNIIESCFDLLPVWLPSNPSGLVSFKKKMQENLLNRLELVVHSDIAFSDDVPKDEIKTPIEIFVDSLTFEMEIDQAKFLIDLEAKLKQIERHDIFVKTILEELGKWPVTNTPTQLESIVKTLADALIEPDSSSNISKMHKENKFEDVIRKWITTLPFNHELPIDIDEEVKILTTLLKHVALTTEQESAFFQAFKNAAFEKINELPLCTVCTNEEKMKISKNLAADLAGLPIEHIITQKDLLHQAIFNWLSSLLLATSAAFDMDIHIQAILNDIENVIEEKNPKEMWNHFIKTARKHLKKINFNINTTVRESAAIGLANTVFSTMLYYVVRKWAECVPLKPNTNVDKGAFSKTLSDKLKIIYKTNIGLKTAILSELHKIPAPCDKKEKEKLADLLIESIIVLPIEKRAKDENVSDTKSVSGNSYQAKNNNDATRDPDEKCCNFSSTMLKHRDEPTIKPDIVKKELNTGKLDMHIMTDLFKRVQGWVDHVPFLADNVDRIEFANNLISELIDVREKTKDDETVKYTIMKNLNKHVLTIGNDKKRELTAKLLDILKRTPQPQLEKDRLLEIIKKWLRTLSFRSEIKADIAQISSELAADIRIIYETGKSDEISEGLKNTILLHLSKMSLLLSPARRVTEAEKLANKLVTQLFVDKIAKICDFFKICGPISENVCFDSSAGNKENFEDILVKKIMNLISTSDSESNDNTKAQTNVNTLKDSPIPCDVIEKKRLAKDTAVGLRALPRETKSIKNMTDIIYKWIDTHVFQSEESVNKQLITMELATNLHNLLENTTVSKVWSVMYFAVLSKLDELPVKLTYSGKKFAAEKLINTLLSESFNDKVFNWVTMLPFTEGTVINKKEIACGLIKKLKYVVKAGNENCKQYLKETAIEELNRLSVQCDIAEKKRLTVELADMLSHVPQEKDIIKYAIGKWLKYVPMQDKTHVDLYQVIVDLTKNIKDKLQAAQPEDCWYLIKSTAEQGIKDIMKERELHMLSYLGEKLADDIIYDFIYDSVSSWIYTVPLSTKKDRLRFSHQLVKKVRESATITPPNKLKVVHKDIALEELKEMNALCSESEMEVLAESFANNLCNLPKERDIFGETVKNWVNTLPFENEPRGGLVQFTFDLINILKYIARDQNSDCVEIFTNAILKKLQSHKLKITSIEMKDLAEHLANNLTSNLVVIKMRNTLRNIFRDFGPEYTKVPIHKQVYDMIENLHIDCDQKTKMNSENILPETLTDKSVKIPELSKQRPSEVLVIKLVHTQPDFSNMNEDDIKEYIKTMTIKCRALKEKGLNKTEVEKKMKAEVDTFISQFNLPTFLHLDVDVSSWLKEVLASFSKKDFKKLVTNLMDKHEDVDAELFPEETVFKEIKEDIVNQLDILFAEDGQKVENEAKTRLANIFCHYLITKYNIKQKCFPIKRNKFYTTKNSSLDKIIKDWITQIPELKIKEPSERKLYEKIGYVLSMNIERIIKDQMDESTNITIMNEINQHLNEALDIKPNFMEPYRKLELVKKLTDKVNKSIKDGTLSVYCFETKKQKQNPILKENLRKSRLKSRYQEKSFENLAKDNLKNNRKDGQYKKSDLIINVKLSDELYNTMNFVDILVENESNHSSDTSSSNFFNTSIAKPSCSLGKKNNDELDSLVNTDCNFEKKTKIRNFEDKVVLADPEINDILPKEICRQEIDNHIQTKAGTTGSLEIENSTKLIEHIPESLNSTSDIRNDKERFDKTLITNLNDLEMRDLENKWTRKKVQTNIKETLETALQIRNKKWNLDSKSRKFDKMTDVMSLTDKEKHRYVTKNITKFAQNTQTNVLKMMQRTSNENNSLKAMTKDLSTKIIALHMQGLQRTELKNRIASEIKESVQTLFGNNVKHADSSIKRKLTNHLLNKVVGTLDQVETRSTSNSSSSSLHSPSRDNERKVIANKIKSWANYISGVSIYELERNEKSKILIHRLVNKLTDSKPTDFSDKIFLNDLKSKLSAILNSVYVRKDATINVKIKLNEIHKFIERLKTNYSISEIPKEKSSFTKVIQDDLKIWIESIPELRPSNSVERKRNKNLVKNLSKTISSLKQQTLNNRKELKDEIVSEIFKTLNSSLAIIGKNVKIDKAVLDRWFNYSDEKLRVTIPKYNLFMSEAKTIKSYTEARKIYIEKCIEYWIDTLPALGSKIEENKKLNKVITKKIFNLLNEGYVDTKWKQKVLSEIKDTLDSILKLKRNYIDPEVKYDHAKKLTNNLYESFKMMEQLEIDIQEDVTNWFESIPELTTTNPKTNLQIIGINKQLSSYIFSLVVANEDANFKKKLSKCVHDYLEFTFAIVREPLDLKTKQRVSELLFFQIYQRKHEVDQLDIMNIFRKDITKWGQSLCELAGTNSHYGTVKFNVFCQTLAKSLTHIRSQGFEIENFQGRVFEAILKHMETKLFGNQDTISTKMKNKLASQLFNTLKKSLYAFECSKTNHENEPEKYCEKQRVDATNNEMDTTLQNDINNVLKGLPELHLLSNSDQKHLVKTINLMVFNHKNINNQKQDIISYADQILKKDTIVKELLKQLDRDLGDLKKQISYKSKHQLVEKLYSKIFVINERGKTYNQLKKLIEYWINNIPELNTSDRYARIENEKLTQSLVRKLVVLEPKDFINKTVRDSVLNEIKYKIDVLLNSSGVNMKMQDKAIYIEQLLESVFSVVKESDDLEKNLERSVICVLENIPNILTLLNKTICSTIAKYLGKYFKQFDSKDLKQQLVRNRVFDDIIDQLSTMSGDKFLSLSVSIRNMILLKIWNKVIETIEKYEEQHEREPIYLKKEISDWVGIPGLRNNGLSVNKPCHKFINYLSKQLSQYNAEDFQNYQEKIISEVKKDFDCALVAEKEQLNIKSKHELSQNLFDNVLYSLKRHEELKNELKTYIFEYIQDIPELTVTKLSKDFEKDIEILANKCLVDNIKQPNVKSKILQNLIALLDHNLEKSGECLDCETKQTVAENLLELIENKLELSERQTLLPKIIQGDILKWIESKPALINTSIHSKSKNNKIIIDLAKHLAEVLLIENDDSITRDLLHFIIAKKLNQILDEKNDYIDSKIKDELAEDLLDIVIDSAARVETREERKIRKYAKVIRDWLGNIPGMFSSTPSCKKVIERVSEKITLEIKKLNKEHFDDSERLGRLKCIFRDNLDFAFKKIKSKSYSILQLTEDLTEQIVAIDNKYKKISDQLKGDLEKTIADWHQEMPYLSCSSVSVRKEIVNVSKELAHKVRQLKTLEKNEREIQNRIKVIFGDHLVTTFDKKGEILNHKIRNKLVEKLLRKLAKIPAVSDWTKITVSKNNDNINLQSAIEQWVRDFTELSTINHDEDKIIINLSNLLNNLQSSNLENKDTRNALLENIKLQLDSISQTKNRPMALETRNILANNLLRRVIDYKVIKNNGNLYKVFQNDVLRWFDDIPEMASFKHEELIKWNICEILAKKLVHLQATQLDNKNKQQEMFEVIRQHLDHVLDKKNQHMPFKERNQWTNKLLNQIMLSTNGVQCEGASKEKQANVIWEWFQNIPIKSPEKTSENLVLVSELNAKIREIQKKSHDRNANNNEIKNEILSWLTKITVKNKNYLHEKTKHDLAQKLVDSIEKIQGFSKDESCFKYSITNPNSYSDNNTDNKANSQKYASQSKPSCSTDKKKTLSSRLMSGLEIYYLEKDKNHKGGEVVKHISEDVQAKIVDIITSNIDDVQSFNHSFVEKVIFELLVDEAGLTEREAELLKSSIVRQARIKALEADEVTLLSLVKRTIISCLEAFNIEKDKKTELTDFLENNIVGNLLEDSISVTDKKKSLLRIQRISGLHPDEAELLLDKITEQTKYALTVADSEQASLFKARPSRLTWTKNLYQQHIYFNKPIVGEEKMNELLQDLGQEVKILKDSPNGDEKIQTKIREKVKEIYGDLEETELRKLESDLYHNMVEDAKRSNSIPNKAQSGLHMAENAKDSKQASLDKAKAWTKNLPPHIKPSVSEDKIDKLLQNLAHEVRALKDTPGGEDEIRKKIPEKLVEMFDNLDENELKRLGSELYHTMLDEGNQDTSEFVGENFHGAIVDWLKLTPLYQKATPEQKKQQEEVVSQMAPDIKRAFENSEQSSAGSDNIREAIKQSLKNIITDPKLESNDKLLDSAANIILNHLTERTETPIDLLALALDGFVSDLPIETRTPDQQKKLEIAKKDLENRLKLVRAQLPPSSSQHAQAIRDEGMKFMRNNITDPSTKGDEHFLIDKANTLLMILDVVPITAQDNNISTLFKSPADKLYEFVEEWCNDLPIQEDPDKTKAIKQVLASKLINRISELNMNPDIFNDEELYKDILPDEIEQLLSDVPSNPELDKYLSALNKELISKVLEARQRMLNDLAGKAYRLQLRDTIHNTLPLPYNLSTDELNELELLKDKVADAFISLHYVSGCGEAKSEYMKKIRDEIQIFCNDILRYYSCSPMNTNQLKKDLYNALLRVPIPRDDSMKSEVEQIRIRDIINDWMRDIPLRQELTTEKLHRYKLAAIMAKRLHDVETETEYNPYFEVEPKMDEEITKFLKKLPLSYKAVERIPDLANKLISKLKNTGNSRKFVSLRRSRSAETQAEICSRYPCTLTEKDKAYLKEIREMANNRCTNSFTSESQQNDCSQTDILLGNACWRSKSTGVNEIIDRMSNRKFCNTDTPCQTQQNDCSQTDIRLGNACWRSKSIAGSTNTPCQPQQNNCSHTDVNLGSRYRRSTQMVETPNCSAFSTPCQTSTPRPLFVPFKRHSPCQTQTPVTCQPPTPLPCPITFSTSSQSCHYPPNQDMILQRNPCNLSSFCPRPYFSSRKTPSPCPSRSSASKPCHVSPKLIIKEYVWESADSDDQPTCFSRDDRRGSVKTQNSENITEKFPSEMKSHVEDDDDDDAENISQREDVYADNFKSPGPVRFDSYPPMRRVIEVDQRLNGTQNSCVRESPCNSTCLSTEDEGECMESFQRSSVCPSRINIGRPFLRGNRNTNKRNCCQIERNTKCCGEDDDFWPATKLPIGKRFMPVPKQTERNWCRCRNRVLIRCFDGSDRMVSVCHKCGLNCPLPRYALSSQ